MTRSHPNNDNNNNNNNDNPIGSVCMLYMDPHWPSIHPKCWHQSTIHGSVMGIIFDHVWWIKSSLSSHLRPNKISSRTCRSSLRLATAVGTWEPHKTRQSLPCGNLGKNVGKTWETYGKCGDLTSRNHEINHPFFSHCWRETCLTPKKWKLDWISKFQMYHIGLITIFSGLDLTVQSFWRGCYKLFEWRFPKALYRSASPRDIQLWLKNASTSTDFWDECAPVGHLLGGSSHLVSGL